MSVRVAKVRSVRPDVFVTLALPLLTFTALASTLMVVRRGGGSERRPTTAEARPTLPVQVNGPASESNPKTVEVLLDAVRRMLDEEDRRGESLNLRASAVAGFLAIMIGFAGTIVATASRSGGEFHAVAAGLAGAAMVALVTAIGLLGWGVLLPGSAKAISIHDVEAFPTRRWINEETVMVRGYLLRGAIGVLKRDRERNNWKARWLRYGYLGMGAGLLLVSAAGLVLAIEVMTRA